MTISISKFSSRLSPEQVEEIRREPLPTRHADLARRFGVTATTIARIRRGETWSVENGEVIRIRVSPDTLLAVEHAARNSQAAPEEIVVGVLAEWANRYRTE